VKKGSPLKGTELRGLYLPQKRDRIVAGVISEDWPVWLSVLPALGIKNAVTWRAGQSTNSNAYFLGEFPGLRFISSKKKLMTRKLDVVFVSGSPRFVRETCSGLEDQIIWATCPALQGKRLGILGETGLRWNYISHAEVGGVTSGGYWVGSNVGVQDWTPAFDPNYRSLRDVLSPVEDGLPMSKPPSDVNERPSGVPTIAKHGKYLSGNLLLPIGEWDAQVATLSVFSRTGWVSRQLTPKELVVSFDLPVALHKHWLKASKDLPFLSTTPSKVLMSVSDTIGFSLAAVARDLLDVVAAEDFVELPLPLPTGPVTQVGVAIKAAKAEGAEAEVALWDAEIVDLFPKLSSLPKEVLHKSCEALRNGQMLWWKKSVTMEVREYLYLKYGIDWKTTTSRENPELDRD
jgi:hypothetical protein